MSDSSVEGLIDGEDYYTFLNIPKGATDEEISTAYRRLCRLYHPDKHLHPERKKEAEILFSKTKKAYEVLSDGLQRAIYDSVGVAGLATRGWEVVHRTKTPQEIREEYERLAREREQHRLQQHTNPKSAATIGVDATSLFAPANDNAMFLDLRDYFGLPHIEISGMTLHQSIESPLTSKDTLVMAGDISSHNGRGTGSVSCALRRVISEKSWAVVQVGAGSGITLAAKVFRSFSRGIFANASLQGDLTPNGIRIGSAVTAANHLDQHTVGYLTWKMGLSTGMSTMVIRDTERMHAVATVHFGIPHSHLLLSCTHKMAEHEATIKLMGKIGTFGGMVEYSADKKISQHSQLSATMTVGIPVGVSVRLRLQRATQVYTCNIVLCEELLPAPIVYGTLLPVVGWLVLDRLIIQPYLVEQKRLSLARQREANKTRLSELKREAAAAVELMKETVKRIVTSEENKKGLVILRASYGRLVTTDESEAGDEVLDVTVPLQCLVTDSKLILHEPSKCQLPGFYDPSPGEEKSLHVKYLFHAVTHKVTIKDTEGLRIPRQSHRADP